MARITLPDSGFTVIPEGTHVFKITGVKYKEEFGKLEVQMETRSGQKHTERFSLLSSDGSPNQGAFGAFAYFARAALNDFTLKEIDHEDLVGHFIEADVEHNAVPSNKDPKKNVTFVKLAEKRPSDGWKEVTMGDIPELDHLKGQDAPTAKPKAKVDLAALLGD